MKKMMVVASFLCLSATANECEPPRLSMILLNGTQPFVSLHFAVRLASLIIEDRYPREMFVIVEPAKIEDEGEFWKVTVENALKNSKFSIVRLSITIRKSNGEIVDFS
jgi:hypothetical protein